MIFKGRAFAFVCLFIIGSSVAFSASAQNEALLGSFNRNLTVGSVGSDVSTLQEFLITEGFLHIAAPTAYLGNLTAAAIAAWQASVGLPSTGFFGPLSRATISGVTPANPATTTTPTQTTGANVYERNLTVGSTGSDVTSLQVLLISQGYLSIPNPTGLFGPLTAAALARWQANAGLPSTGFFGPLSRTVAENNTASIGTAPSTVNSSPTTPVSAPVTTPIITTPTPTKTSTPTSTPISTPISTGGGSGGGSGGGTGGGGGGGGGGGPIITPPPITNPTTTPTSTPTSTGDITPPTISISSPTSNSTIGSTIIVSITASDDTAVTKVELYVDGILNNTKSVSPYTFALNTTLLPDGLHALSGKAYDDAGNVGTSANVSVTVNNQDIVPPSIPTGLSATAVSSTQINLLWNASTDNTSVAGYKIYRNAVQIATTSVTSYQNTGLTSSTAYTYTVAAYDAAGNTSVPTAGVVGTTLGIPDLTPPNITLTGPANSSTVSSTVTVSATATDNIGVASVQFTLDGANLGAIVTTPPYQVFWNTLGSATGTHTLAAVARDGAGNTKTSPSVTVTVFHVAVDVTSPTVSITSPSASSTVGGIITINTTSSDNVGVTKVELYVDGTLKSTATSSPYSFSLDTTSLTTGAHTLTAKAYDAATNVGTSANVSITVVVLNPTVPGGLSASSATTSTVALAWSASTEPGGAIVGYKIYRGGVQIATTSLTAFTNTGLTPSTTYSYAVASYDTGGLTSATSTSASITTLQLPLNYKFGLSIGEDLMGPSNAATLNSKLNDITSLGFGWVRIDMEWDHVQPNNSSSYGWTDVDNFVTAALAHRLKILAILDYTPNWQIPAGCVANDDRCAPSSASAFGTYAAAAANRYTSQGVTAWEIWNEPNLQGSWEPAASATQYLAILKAGYNAIKAVNPSATVISAGMGPAATGGGSIAPTDFLTSLYAQGAEPYFDAVGDHPYSFPAMPSYFQTWNAWQQMSVTNPSLRSIMIANGDSAKQIWMTEYGAPTGGPGIQESSATDTVFAGHPDHVSEALQSLMVTDAVTLTESYSWAGPLFWYSYKDLGTSNTTVENFFGIIRNDGSTKPAYQTFKNLISGN